MNFEQENSSEQNQSSVESLLEQEQQAVSELQACTTELALWKDQCKRISADYENYQKRMDREQARWADLAKESVLKDLLQFVDTFELARKDISSKDQVAIDMMNQSLLKVLNKHDVVFVPVDLEFDPVFHEAVMQVESAQHSSGQIVEVLSKGFMVKNKVIRPAKVSVAV